MKGGADYISWKNHECKKLNSYGGAKGYSPTHEPIYKPNGAKQIVINEKEQCQPIKFKKTRLRVSTTIPLMRVFQEPVHLEAKEALDLC